MTVRDILTLARAQRRQIAQASESLRARTAAAWLTLDREIASALADQRERDLRRISLRELDAMVAGSIRPRALADAGLNNAWAVAKLSPQALLGVRGIGPKSVPIVQQAIAAAKRQVEGRALVIDRDLTRGVHVALWSAAGPAVQATRVRQGLEAELAAAIAALDEWTTRLRRQLRPLRIVSTANQRSHWEHDQTALLELLDSGRLQELTNEATRVATEISAAATIPLTIADTNDRLVAITSPHTRRNGARARTHQVTPFPMPPSRSLPATIDQVPPTVAAAQRHRLLRPAIVLGAASLLTFTTVRALGGQAPGLVSSPAIAVGATTANAPTEPSVPVDVAPAADTSVPATNEASVTDTAASSPPLVTDPPIVPSPSTPRPRATPTTLATDDPPPSVAPRVPTTTEPIRASEPPTPPTVALPPATTPPPPPATTPAPSQATSPATTPATSPPTVPPPRTAPTTPPATAPPSPPTVAVAVQPAIGNGGCHPSYTPCLPMGRGDYDCAGGTGNGPNYTGPVTVIGPDKFGLDDNGNGLGCEDS